MRVLLAIGLLLFVVAPTAAQDGTASQAPSPSADTPAQSPADKLVISHVTVMANTGGYVTGLREDAFIVLVDKWPREIKFFSHEDEPLTIAVLFDLSGSMLGGPTTTYDLTRIKLLKEHFAQFVQNSNPSNEYFVIGFASRAQLLAEGVPGEKAVLTASSLLSSNKPKGSTAFYDACYFALENVRRGKHLKKAILVFSDGEDNASKRKFDGLRRALVEETPVMFFAVDIPGHVQWSREGRAGLDELSTITGGKAFLPENAKELIASLNILAMSLRNQYTLGFAPDSTARGEKWHRIKVEVRLPPNSPVKQKDIFVRSRAGYYATR